MNFFCNFLYFLATLDSCNPAFDSILWAVETVGVEDVSRKCYLEDELPCWMKWGSVLDFQPAAIAFLPSRELTFQSDHGHLLLGFPQNSFTTARSPCDLDMKKAELSFGIATNIIKQFRIVLDGLQKPMHNQI